MSLSATKSLENVPERKVGAAERGPGPAVYMPPGDFDKQGRHPTKKGASAFSMGSTARPKVKDESPGPVYDYDRSATSKGKAQAPAFSLSSRSTLKNKEHNPAPGQYNSVEVAKSSRTKQAPAYSLRVRPPISDETPAPSPSTYSLPSLMTRSSTSNKASSAAFSMGTRIKSPKGRHAPGPGEYNVKAYDSRKRNSPGYSFGVKPKTKQRESGPSATQYNPMQKSKVKGGTFGARYSPYVYNPIAK
eukprot:TRINITY_DN9806_c0_g2_i2.p1 TRINITY_DN9806_c0_g2~~TRINITY_DN9806_c0_g2_i2.p1  ORF type:complete len:246 (+),score=43.09 TRINITY_DN9806_c0_g2_i2:275-1012(+)